jgi:hypothetical protein
MLETPKNGWSTLSLGTFSDRVSDLDDVPFLLLDALIRVLETHQPAAVRFDAEGYSYTVVFDEHDTVVFYDVSIKHETIEISATTLASALLADIRRDMPLWVSWQDDYRKADKTALSARQKRLLRRCDKLDGWLHPNK